MTPFAKYNSILLEGFINNAKANDIVNKKRDLLDNILDYYKLTPKSILFVGFSPWCLTLNNQHFTVTEVGADILDFLDSRYCKYTYKDFNDLNTKDFDIVVASDEYFTFANNDQEQRNLVDKLSKVTKNLIITTLRDYKNQDFKDREFSQPIVVRGQNSNKIFLEHYEYDPKDKNSSTSKTFVIDDTTSIMHGPFARRNMYFKQLAKFSIDVGATSFYVHKNLMYKSIIKKNYEHVITIKF